MQVNSIPTDLGTLFDAAASTNPTPGGGSVAAICGYLAIALAIKAARISAKRADVSAAIQLNECAEALEVLSVAFKDYAQEDVRAFGAFIDAMQLSKDTVMQQGKRKVALQAAAFAAANAAVSMLCGTVKVLDLCIGVRPLIARNIIADLNGAVGFMRATASVARENAVANIESIVDSQELILAKQEFENACARLDEVVLVWERSPAA